MLLPLLAAADSGVEMGANNAALRDSAHLDFKIVIPKMLYLDVSGGIDRNTGARTAAIMSNSRNIILTASHPRPPGLAKGKDRHFILSAAARKIIARDTACTLAVSQRVTIDSSHWVCTASMP